MSGLEDDKEVAILSQNATGVNVQTQNASVDLDDTGDVKEAAAIPELEHLGDDLAPSVAPTSLAAADDAKIDAETKEVKAVSKIQDSTKNISDAAAAIVKADVEVKKAAEVVETAAVAAKQAEDSAKKAEVQKKKAEEEKKKAEALKEEAEEEKKKKEAEKKKLQEEKKKAEEAKKKAEEEAKKAAAAAKKAADEKKIAEEAAKKKAAAETKRKSLEQMDPMTLSVTAEYRGVCVGWVKSNDSASAPMVMAACAKTKENTCPAVFNDKSCTLLQPMKTNVTQGAKVMMF